MRNISIFKNPLTAWLEEAAEGTPVLSASKIVWQKGDGRWWAAGSDVPRESLDLVGEGPFVALYGTL
ncbi:hypothetical protein JOJ86_001483 [Rhodococcus percolatus]|uniref:hypothetical protein n=1 Tax=Rhodococcus opacus TaxID=37919 RepID=UPI0015F8E9C9|nr:hypothetical protein [Rhodococcus opacus]MBA8958192.1 hypothetical protein [Rhodococcus opacus]MBP2203757.1 hypothetical protein [Rhodococcus opacus]